MAQNSPELSTEELKRRADEGRKYGKIFTAKLVKLTDDVFWTDNLDVVLQAVEFFKNNGAVSILHEVAPDPRDTEKLTAIRLARRYQEMVNNVWPYLIERVTVNHIEGKLFIVTFSPQTSS